MQHNFDFLNNHALFGGLSSEDIAVVKELLVQESFAADTTIIREGEQGDRLYFILTGTVEVVKLHSSNGEDNPWVITKLQRGDTFGEMELIDVQARSATVNALTNVVVLSLSNRALFELYQSQMRLFALITLNMAREISRRLRLADERIAVEMFDRSE